MPHILQQFCERIKKQFSAGKGKYNPNMLLMFALHYREFDVANKLIDIGFDVSYKCPYYYALTFTHTNRQEIPKNSTALTIALLRYNNKGLIHKILDKTNDVNISNGYGMYPIHYAAYYDLYEIIEKLIDKNSKIDPINNNRVTPLLLAARTGGSRIVELLLKYGANVNHCDKTYSTPLIHASSKGNIDKMKLLLKYGANINHTNMNGDTALTLSCHHSSSIKVETLVQDKNINVNMSNNFKNTPLMLACNNNKITENCIKLLLDKNADINVQNLAGDTALILASIRMRPKFVKLLLQHGANPNIQNNKGETALMYAVSEGYGDIVQLLIKYRCDINIKNSDGKSAFIFQRSMVWIPGIDRGFGYNMAKDREKKLLQQQLDIVKILIRNGCDLKIKDNENKTYRELLNKDHLEEIDKTICERYKESLVKHCVNFIKIHRDLYKDDELRGLHRYVRRYFRLENIDEP